MWSLRRTRRRMGRSRLRITRSTLGKSRRFAFRRVDYIAALIAYAHLQINNDFEAVNVNGRTSRSIQPILGRGCPITAGFLGYQFLKNCMLKLAILKQKRFNHDVSILSLIYFSWQYRLVVKLLVFKHGVF